MFKSLREKIGERSLRKLTPKSANRYPGLADLSSVIVLFNADNQDDFVLVKKYITYLREFPKQVKGIGFFDSKEMPELKYSRNDFEFFSRKDLDFFYRPKSEGVATVLNGSYDLLIDLNLNGSFPLYYLAALINARVKVGLRSPKNEAVSDLMLEVDPAQGLKNYLRHIDTYLLMLGPDKNKKETV